MKLLLVKNADCGHFVSLDGMNSKLAVTAMYVLIPADCSSRCEGTVANGSARGATIRLT